MSLAYLEIGSIAATAESEFKNVDVYENAEAYQLFHAIELFYKYMIIRKQGTLHREDRVHDLSDLERKYLSLYPDESFISGITGRLINTSVING